MKTVININKSIDYLRNNGKEVGGISDGFHTFDELYAHRVALFIALCNYIYEFGRDDMQVPWKSTKHFDETSWDGWFIAGIGQEPGRQITYHLPMSAWDDLKVVTYDKAPCEWDGHTPADVIERLLKLTS